MENKTIIRTDHNDTIMIELDRPRALRMTHRVLKEFSALSHVRMSEMGDALDDYSKLSCLYYCMLHADDPRLTVDRVDELLDPVPIYQLVTLAAEVINAAFGDQSAEAAADEDPTGEHGSGMRA